MCQHTHPIIKPLVTPQGPSKQVTYCCEDQVRVEILEDVVNGTIEVLFRGLIPLQCLFPNKLLKGCSQLIYCS